MSADDPDSLHDQMPQFTSNEFLSHSPDPADSENQEQVSGSLKYEEGENDEDDLRAKEIRRVREELESS